MIAAVLVGLALAAAALTTLVVLHRRSCPACPDDPLPDRPGSDDQWRAWTGPDGHPLPLNDQTHADLAEGGQTSGPQGE